MFFFFFFFFFNVFRFILWYDDLGEGNMTTAFFENFERLREERFPWLGRDNVALLRVGGSLGGNEAPHINGVIASLNITHIIRADLT